MSDAFLGPYQFYSVLDFTAARLHSPLAGRRELWSAAHHNCVVMLLQIFCKPVALQLWYDPYSKQGLTPLKTRESCFWSLLN